MHKSIDFEIVLDSDETILWIYPANGEKHFSLRQIENIFSWFLERDLYFQFVREKGSDLIGLALPKELFHVFLNEFEGQVHTIQF